MILLLGATGYIGQAFSNELRRRGNPFIPLTRSAIDYTQFEILFDYVRKIKPSFIINAAGYTGRPNIDACEIERKETLQANALFPQNIAKVCRITNTSWGHVSSASIYSGAKVLDNGYVRVQRDINDPATVAALIENPEGFFYFTEKDEPNFSFRNGPCNFYSGTKALAEESLHDFGNNYIWRPGIVFDEFDHSRNFLTRLQHCAKIHDVINPLSHRSDFVKVCLDLWEATAPFGIYNVVNPGAMSNRQIVGRVSHILKSEQHFQFWESNEEFYQETSASLRPGCLVSAAKVLSSGIKMRPLEQALDYVLHHWQTSHQPVPEMALAY